MIFEFSVINNYLIVVAAIVFVIVDVVVVTVVVETIVCPLSYILNNVVVIYIVFL